MQKLVLYLIGPLIPVLSMAVISMLGSSKLAHIDGHADPFAPYEAMLPGQPVLESTDYSCDRQFATGEVEVTNCERLTDPRTFVSVSSSVFEGRFVRTWFRAHDLYIGDVVARWGRPDVIVKDERSFYLQWKEQGLLGIIDPVGTIGLFNYMLPVENFTISLTPNAVP